LRGLRERYRELLTRQAEDLPSLAWVECALLALATLLAKWMAVQHLFATAPLRARLVALARALPLDLLLLAVMFLLALLARRLPSLSAPLRAPSAAALILAQTLMSLALFANVEFFASWGSPLTPQLLQLAPPLARYILVLGVSDKSGVLSAGGALAVACLLLGPVLASWIGPLLVRGDRWTRTAWLAPAVLGVAGVCLLASPPLEYRETALRRLSLLAMVAPVRESSSAAAPATPEQTAALRELLGPEQDERPAQALSRLRGRPKNVVLWVWESVGARYLRSLHAQGVVATPQLDRLMGRGAVQFSQAYSECPLTVQTTWALITGLSPPAKPFVFQLYGDDPKVSLPRHGPTLHGELRRAGFRTGLFYSSYTRLWHARAILDLAPFDTLEDAQTLEAQGQPRHAFGVDDEATARRALAWLDGPDRRRPFALVYWSVETHIPYTWLGMPAALRAADGYTRYRAALERADGILGMFYDGLAERGLADDTLIVVVGDHGQGLGRPPRSWDLSHSFRVFEDGIHVPLVFLHSALKPPAGQPPLRVPTLVTHVDLFPTLLELLGLPPPAGLDGRSLLRPYPTRPFFARSLVWWPLAIRAGRYKLILPEAGGTAALYDIETDALEEHDLMRTRPEVGQLLLSELYRWHAERFQSDPTFGYHIPVSLPSS
jgi:arylsulfatase A-like enzyme